MHKHLPGKHNQKKHAGESWATESELDAKWLESVVTPSVAKNWAEQWHNNGLASSLRGFVVGLGYIPDVRKSFVDATYGHLKVALQTDPDTLAGMLSLSIKGSNVNLGIINSEKPNPFIGLGKKKANAVLNEIEQHLAAAKFSRVTSNLFCVPAGLAAEHGYKLFSGIDGKRAYQYLNREYGFRLPSQAEMEFASVQPFTSLADVMQIKHKNHPEIRLYSEYLGQSYQTPQGDDPLLQYPIIEKRLNANH